MLGGEGRKGDSSLRWSPESLGITEQTASPYPSLPELLRLYEAGGTDLSKCGSHRPGHSAGSPEAGPEATLWALVTFSSEPRGPG